ncbi:MAG: FAD-dependent oxidoreductase [Bryobacteraceae bacterium]|nr:FAD-dependent oxidoreductase [Bryobacteraceae bacterium]
MFDTVVVGAGAAGLTAARILGEAGHRVLIAEARDRAGGRMWSEPLPGLPVVAELGAEFIHGTPEATWELIRKWGIPAQERCGNRLCYENGKLGNCTFPEQVDEIFSTLETYRGEDISFSQFVATHAAHFDQTSRRWAREYIEGFDAADSENISVKWLQSSSAAEEADEGHKLFAISTGYSSLVSEMIHSLPNDATLRLACPVRSVKWSESGVVVATDSGTFSCRFAVLTVPPPVLPSVRFDPPVPNTEAAKRIATGPVMRVTLAFRESFWPSFSMLHSHAEDFPTWWTHLPVTAPVLTAWCGGPRAARLSALTRAEIIDRALDALSRLLNTGRSRIEDSLVSAHTHNWQTDEWSKGAYSYVTAGNTDATAQLAAPVGNRLFFAGEASESTGRSGLVHGAILTGQRAAREILSL